MNRLGFLPEQFRTAYARLQTISAVRSISSLTHFANAEDADNPALPINEQVSRFRNTVQGIPGEYSLSNSATVLLHPNLAGDWVRPGIMLYGGSPGGGTAKEFGLQPAMTLTSEIIGVQSVMPGDAIGYGSRYVATRPMQIGVVACGYADGYPRHAPNGTPILVDGVKTQIIGRVSMDMMTVDLTPVTNPHIGSKVTLWGEGLPIDEVANAAGTIGYELMCALAPRVRVVEQ
jgi:alanine racemase